MIFVKYIVTGFTCGFFVSLVLDHYILPVQDVPQTDYLDLSFAPENTCDCYGDGFVEFNVEFNDEPADSIVFV